MAAVDKASSDEIDLAVRAVRLHAIRESPAGKHCLECGWPAPCVTRRWGVELLEAAGWGQAMIEALDDVPDSVVPALALGVAAERAAHHEHVGSWSP